MWGGNGTKPIDKDQGRTHALLGWAAIAVFIMTLATAVVCNAATPNITQEDLLQKLESGAAPLILDVRTW